MQTTSNRQLRRKLDQSRKFLQDSLTPAVDQLLHNDTVTQGKVAALERTVADLEKQAAEVAKLAATLTLRDRLWWLLTGKFPGA